MNDLTDLEVCQKIADITVADVILSAENSKLWINKNGVYCGNEYNPLTDDALCFQLMVKYDICLRNRGNGYYLSTVNRYDCDARIANESPNKAICLAIIKANYV